MFKLTFSLNLMAIALALPAAEILTEHTADSPLVVAGASASEPVPFSYAGENVLAFADREGETVSTAFSDYLIRAWADGTYPWVYLTNGCYALKGQKIALKGRFKFGHNTFGDDPFPTLALTNCVIETADTCAKTDNNLYFSGGNVELVNCVWTNKSGTVYFSNNNNAFLDVNIKGGDVQLIPSTGLGHVRIGGFGIAAGSGTRVTISGKHNLIRNGSYWLSIGNAPGQALSTRGCDATFVVEGQGTVVDCGSSNLGRIECGVEYTYATTIVTNGATLKTGNFMVTGYNGKLQLYDGSVYCLHSNGGDMDCRRGSVEIHGGLLSLRTDFGGYFALQGDVKVTQTGGEIFCGGFENRNTASERMIRLSSGVWNNSTFNLNGGRLRCRYGIKGVKNIASGTSGSHSHAYLDADGGTIEVMAPHSGVNAQFMLEKLDRAAVGPKGLTIESDFDYTLNQSFTNLVDASTKQLTSGRLVFSGTNPVKRATITLAATSSANDWVVLSGCTGLVAATASYRSNFVVTNNAALTLATGAAATAGLKGVTLGDAATVGTLIFTDAEPISVAGQISCPQGVVVLPSALARGASQTLFVSSVAPTAETLAHWADGLTVAGGASGKTPSFKIRKVDDTWCYDVVNAIKGMAIILR